LACVRMELLRDTIINCLNDYADDEDILLAELDKIIANNGPPAYAAIFHVLTSLVLEPKEAEQCWQEIIAHWRRLSAVIGRRVSLRTAICDYFCSVHKSLRNPKVVEINIFEKTAQSSQIDSLTELYNRRFFDDELSKETARANRYHTQLSLLFLDIDDFKKINDTYGHLAGDKVLQTVARIMVTEKRIEDVAARYGGEEFVIISPETGKTNTLVLAERIRQRVEKKRIDYEGKRIHLTISGGLASYPIDAPNGLTLIRYADSALYRAKASGKNNISLFSEDKRHYIRLDFHNEVFVREMRSSMDNRRKFKAKAKNLSEGGILIENGAPLEIGSEALLDIILNKDSRLNIVGTVVRVEALTVDRYEIGLSFLKLNRNTKTLLTDYLIRQLKNTALTA
jgi:diguanylate cyclase (GGDEF)-like protein